MKTIISVSVDVDTVIEAKRRGINVSRTVANLLKEYLDMPEIKKDEDLNKQISLLKANIQELEEKKKKEESRVIGVTYFPDPKK
jgi:GTP cyclohydrolase FolE2